MEKSEREAGRIELNLYILFNFLLYLFLIYNQYKYKETKMQFDSYEILFDDFRDF